MQDQDMARVAALPLYRVINGTALVIILGVSAWSLKATLDNQVELADLKAKQQHGVMSRLGKIEKNMASAADLAAMALRVGRLESEMDRVAMILMARNSGDTQSFQVLPQSYEGKESIQ